MNSKSDTRIEGNRVRAELYVCASTCGTREKQRTAIRTAERLVEEGVLDAFEKNVWAGRLTTSSSNPWGRLAREKYDEFRTWSDRVGQSLGPAFAKETARNEFVDEEYEVIRFPIVTLAVYADDRLARLAPTGERDRPYTVTDCLEELKARGDRSFGDRAAALEH
jgi:hypothetical protein